MKPVQMVTERKILRRTLPIPTHPTTYLLYPKLNPLNHFFFLPLMEKSINFGPKFYMYSKLAIFTLVLTLLIISSKYLIPPPLNF